MNELHPDWITHRLPTAADADGEGDVKVPYSIESLTKGPRYSYNYLHYSDAVPGQPWWSEKAAANASPAPTRKVVQIAVTPNTPEKKTTLYALCSDSTIWWVSDYSASWTQIPPIPQPGDQ
jgi:hypothetical protein